MYKEKDGIRTKLQKCRSLAIVSVGLHYGKNESYSIILNLMISTALQFQVMVLARQGPILPMAWRKCYNRDSGTAIAGTKEEKELTLYFDVLL